MNIKLLQKKFVSNGYIISKIENNKNFTKINNKIFFIIKKFLKIKSTKRKDLFNDLHKYANKKNVNELRMKIYNKLNNEIWFKEAYFSLAEKTIELIIGSEIAVQDKINFSIQMPNDKSSKLEMHADSLSGESKFQIVLWVPLVDTFRSKSMYIFDKKLIIKEIKNIGKYKYKGMNYIYNKNKHKKKFLKVNKGQFLIFSPNLLHGNVENITNETRISMNCRFKNLFSNYADKSLFGKRMGYFYIPLRIKPATKFSLDFKIPDEF